MSRPRTVAGVFRAMHKLFQQKDTWTKGEAARVSPTGQATLASSKDATCFCYLGALDRVTGDGGCGCELYKQARVIALESVPIMGFTSVTVFNDDRNTTKEHVLEFLEINEQLAKLAGI